MQAETKPSLDDVLSDEKTVKLLCGMARTFAHTYKHNALITYDDLYNEGVLGIHKALSSSTYDPNRCSQFHSYAYHYILEAMTTYCNKFRVNLSASIRDLRERADAIKQLAPGGIDITTIDALYQVDDINTIELRDMIFSGLQEIEKDLLEDKMYRGFSNNELATKYGMSASGVSRMTRNIKQKIRQKGL